MRSPLWALQLAAQRLCVGPNGRQCICQLVHGRLGDGGFRRASLARTTGMVDLKDDGPIPEPENPRANVPRGRVKGRCALRG